MPPATESNNGAVKVKIAIPWCGRNVKKNVVFLDNQNYDVNIPDKELPKSADDLIFTCSESEEDLQVTIKPNMIESEITGCDSCRFRMR